MKRFNSEFLKQSPLFNYSMGSKERFHTEFLAWIFKTFDFESKKFLLSLIDYVSSNQHRITNIKTERNYVDLWVIIEDIESKKKINFIFENKVKSIPNEDQLRDISGKNHSQKEEWHFVLLAPHRPDFFEGDIYRCNSKEWKFISYYSVLKFLLLIKRYLDRGIKTEEFGMIQKYNKFLLADYTRMLRILLKIIEPIREIDDSNGYNYYLKECVNTECLKKLKIHDLYYKNLNSKLSYKLYLYLKAVKEKKYSPKFSGDWEKGTKNDLFIYYGFSNGTGHFDAKLIIEEGLCMGIQVQDEQFRLFIDSITGCKKDYADNLLVDENWFAFHRFTEPVKYPLNETKRIAKFPFCSFKNFLYQYVKIPDQLTVANLFKVIESYITDAYILTNTLKS